MTVRAPLSEILEALARGARELGAAEVPQLLGDLERIRVEALLRAQGVGRPQPAPEDTALDVAQAARLLGITPKTLQNGAHTRYAALRIHTGARALRFDRARVLAFREGTPLARPALAVVAPRTRTGKGRGASR